MIKSVLVSPGMLAGRMCDLNIYETLFFISLLNERII